MKTSCPFDKTHIINLSKLSSHIKNCKSPNRDSYQNCKYNPQHWIFYKDIVQHQQKCQNNQSSNSQILFQCSSQLSFDKKQDTIQNISVIMKAQKIKNTTRIIKKQWQQPNFTKWWQQQDDFDYEQQYKQQQLQILQENSNEFIQQTFLNDQI